MSNPPQLLTTAYSFSESELSAACLDGDVYRIGAAYSPVDIAQSPALRLASIFTLIPEGFAFSGQTAAWIYGWTTRLEIPLHAGRISKKRIRFYPEQGIYLSDVFIPEEDVEQFLRGAVTTQIRTIIDLARSSDPNIQERVWSPALIDIDLVTKALEVLKNSSNRAKGRSLGIETLEKVLETSHQEEVTR